MRAMPMLLAMTLLTACDPAPTAPAAKASPLPPSEFQKKVAALSEAERNIVFIRAIRDAGKDCQGVTGHERQADLPTGEHYFVASCSDGAKYGVLLGRTDTAKIISRN